MNSELIAEAMFAEHERAYASARWLREWRRLEAPADLYAPAATLPPTVAEGSPLRCPVPETRMAAGR